MSETKIKTAKDFADLANIETGYLRGQLAMFNMSPSGWKAAVKQDLPPSEKGYHFEPFRSSSGRREIVGCEIGESQENAFFVVDIDLILDDATATRIAEGLNMKYRSDAARQSRLED